MVWLRGLGWIVLTFVLLLSGPALMLASGEVATGGRWYAADRSPTGLAPAPAGTREAVVQVYAARAFSWRGAFGAHTWIAAKPAGAGRYTVFEVTRWRDSRLVTSSDEPDRTWFGNRPSLLADLRGAAAEAAIADITAAVDRYPWRGLYRIWPGPNSNTFTAWVIRQSPALDVALPSTAIGKDYLGDDILAVAPSGRGVQVSLGGVAGLLAGIDEGVEVNILGLVVGLDPTWPAFKLPGIGRVGFADRPPAQSSGS